jgi:trehalose/maltose hydrolase-like predicted phosphorylase
MKSIHAVLVLLFIVFSLPLTGQHTSDNWELVATSVGDYTGAPVANGRIGILPWKEPFSVRHVILNHVFDISSESGVTRVLKGINPFVLRMNINGKQVTENNISGWQQTINMKEATHRTSFRVGGDAEVEYTIVALRNLPYSGIVNVRVKALRNISFDVTNEMDVPSEYVDVNHGYKSLYAGKKRVDILQVNASSEKRKHNVSASSLFIFPSERLQYSVKDNRQSSIEGKLVKGEEVSFSLVGSICTTRDFSDPYSESERQVIYCSHEGVESLLRAHKRLWEELWEGDIIIEGDDDAHKAVRFALYNLYSYCRAGSNLSISPMGLSSQGYNGHIFWDSEIWMFPPMLFLNQGIAESMINYRVDRMHAAAKKADAYGYRGVMFPWESDDAGEESTPIFATTGPFEHHITADISIACWNYYCMTNDLRWLKEKGYPLMKMVADFWVSRVEKNDDGSYSIKNVVGADEYAEGKTDNAFTNGAAKRALEYATEAAKICGEEAPSQWQEVGDNILFHAFDDGVTKEYIDYEGEMIKQADVNLLGYPLNLITDPVKLKKDLDYYESKVDNIHGPAMTYSIFCVQYARLGDADKATEMFNRCYLPNIRPPFNVLAETPTSQNPYFATCAGGLLQAVINGFGGLELTRDGVIQQSTVMPKHWKRLTIKGVGKDRLTYVVTNSH